MKSTALARVIRRELLPLDGVSKIAPCRRFLVMYADGDPADQLFYLESGVIKILREGEDSKQIILSIVLPGEIFGEAGLLPGARRNGSAEVMEEGVIHAIPRQVFIDFAADKPEVWSLLSEALLNRQRALLDKIEMLTMRSVEERILFYLRELSQAFGVPEPDGSGHLIRMSQSELAGLVGATRETTSSTLNVLARRGVIQLRRRQIVLLAQRESLRHNDLEPMHAPAEV